VKGFAAALRSDAADLIRSELFGLERLEKHAESLAEAQPVTANPKAGRRLDRRLEENGRALFDAYRGVERAVRDERHITPADEWLLDNFFVAEEHVEERASVLLQSSIQPAPGPRIRGDLLSRGETFGMLLQPLEAEEFAPN